MPGQADGFLYRRAGMAALGSGLIAGPVTWALHQNISYGLAWRACGNGEIWPLWATTAAALAVVIAVGAVSWHARPPLDEGSRDSDERLTRRRARFIGLVAALMAAISALGILVEAIPVLILDPCRGATG